jgi:diguanylate cyclase (GGDEF)-like protein
VLVVTDKVQVECARPMMLAGQEISIGVSLGVSLFPDDAQDARALLRCADSALYHAKALGRNNLKFYQPALRAGVRVER